MKTDLYFTVASELATDVCPACTTRDPLVSAYPYSRIPAFAPLLACWCRVCGFGWVPMIPFSLTEFYETEYGTKHRSDRRIDPAKYFAMLEQPEEEMRPRSLARYANRAKRQHRLLDRYVEKGYSLLEFGSGPGYGLFFSSAAEKHAIEHDESSVKYLRHIGAVRVDLNELEASRYDAVLSSHSLEHLLVGDLYSSLASLRRALRPRGILYIEVPNGAHTCSFLPGNHAPHTLFFNIRALKSILSRAGFEVIESQSLLRPKKYGMKTTMHRPDQLDQRQDAGALTVVARKTEAVRVPDLPPRPRCHVVAPSRRRTGS